jgi:hypothetical protein
MKPNKDIHSRCPKRIGISIKIKSINVAEGKPPVQVNPTAGKALNLNADKLDGLYYLFEWIGAQGRLALEVAP